MLVIESNSVNSGTEVWLEWHVLQTYCFPSNEDCTLKTFWHEYLLLPKMWPDLFTNTTYMTGTFSYFILILFNAKIYTPIWLFSFLLVTKCFFLRGPISQYSNELFLCLLAIFFLSLLSILHEYNIKCSSYCSLWPFNLLCIILQISSTTDCMPLILLTSLISRNFHHIPQEKIKKSFTLLLCWTAQLIQYVPTHDKNLVTSWQCFEIHIFNTDLFSAKLQHRTPLLTAQTVRFISVPLILSLSGWSTGIICIFTPITLYSVFPLLARADKVPEVHYPRGLITE